MELIVVANLQREAGGLLRFLPLVNAPRGAGAPVESGVRPPPFPGLPRTSRAFGTEVGAKGAAPGRRLLQLRRRAVHGPRRIPLLPRPPRGHLPVLGGAYGGGTGRRGHRGYQTLEGGRLERRGFWIPRWAGLGGREAGPASYQGRGHKPGYNPADGRVRTYLRGRWRVCCHSWTSYRR